MAENRWKLKIILYSLLYAYSFLFIGGIAVKDICYFTVGIIVICLCAFITTRIFRVLNAYFT
jgi:hypothetical protein